MKSFIRNSIYIGIVFTSLGLTACGSESSSSVTTNADNAAKSIVISGSTFARPFFENVLEKYKIRDQSTQYAYHSVGSGAGIEQFITGEADIGTTDAPINTAESSRLKEGYEEIIITSGMISIAYNIDGVNTPLNLPRDVYTDIFLGKITQWNDPRIQSANADISLPKSHIQLITRSDSSGTTYAFTQHLSAISPEWKNTFGAHKVIDWPGKAMKAKGNEGVSQRLSITKNSIGYVEFGFAKQLGLKMARLENKHGKFLLPDIKSGQVSFNDEQYPESEERASSISDPDGYPIVTYTWALIRKDYSDPRKTEKVRDLIKWTLNDGQKLAEDLYYLPLSEQIIRSEQSKL